MEDTLRPNAVRAALDEEREVYGLFVALPSPAMVEMVGAAGYDLAILDAEHALVSPGTLEHMIRAAEAFGVTPFVRVPPGDGESILRVLDAGAAGVVVPHVRSRADAEHAVRAARYAPDGTRSLNGGRMAGYGRVDLAGYVAQANAQVMVVVMIEDAEGVDAIEDIVAVPGVDIVLEGAADLSQSLGVPWQTRHPAVTDAVRRIHTACAAAGVTFCAFPRVPADHATWRAAGVRAFVLGEERSLAARALRTHLAEHRDA